MAVFMLGFMVHDEEHVTDFFEADSEKDAVEAHNAALLPGQPAITKDNPGWRSGNARAIVRLATADELADLRRKELVRQ